MMKTEIIDPTVSMNEPDICPECGVEVPRSAAEGLCPESLLKLTHGKQISDALFSPDGKQVLLTSLDNSAMLFDSLDGKLLHTLSGHTAGIESAAFSPDSKKILTASTGNSYRISLTPNGGGGSVGSSHESLIVRIWEVKSGRMVLGLENQAGSVFEKLIGIGASNSQCNAWFSSDGKKIVTASAELQNTAIWDAESGEVIAVLKGHQHCVNWAAFSPDGSQVVTASLQMPPPASMMLSPAGRPSC